MKTSKKSLMTLFILPLIGFGIFAMFTGHENGNGTVTGTVKDKNTNDSLAFVSIELIDPSGKKTARATTDFAGSYSITVPAGSYSMRVSFTGYKDAELKEVKLEEGKITVANIAMVRGTEAQAEAVIELKEVKTKSAKKMNGNFKFEDRAAPEVMAKCMAVPPAAYSIQIADREMNTEQYDYTPENNFRSVQNNPLSTFSIDVDAASYSNIRRFINGGSLPPEDAVRIEEMINYFTYDYPAPINGDPFSVYTEPASCPWNKDHILACVALQGKKIATDNLPPANLVFLIDVSGSMMTTNKLPLVKSSLRLLVDQLRQQDHVAIVVYAGNAGLILPSTKGNEKETIMNAINGLEAGGSTAGGEGILLAYKTAKENFHQEGNNRIILCTDGDFNVGVSSDGELVRIIEEKREHGIFLTVLGYGMGNYKDSKMEKLADKGNGNYAYIDNILEAKKVLVNEMGGTLMTIAKDVKIQVEFNPLKVKEYKLIGYENRMLHDEDFNDDKKDAGEMGSGHRVTALYEIVPVDAPSTGISIDPLKYQSKNEHAQKNFSDELMTVKVRYKEPDGTTSRLVSKIVKWENVSPQQMSDNLKFASAVAEFGLLLRDSKHKGTSSYSKVLNLANAASYKDEFGYRSEFIRLVEAAKLLDNRLSQSEKKPDVTEK